MFTGLMLNTWIAGTVVAVIAGVTGFFAVLRGSTFAAHAIPNGAFAGAAGATLLGFNPLAGLAVFSVAGALGIAGLSRRARNDVATALTLVMMLGVGALFVSWSTEYAQEAYSLLFGEVFGVSSDEVLPIIVLGAISIAAIIVMFRPLLLSSALPEVAEARGVSARRMELAFLVVMALATSMTVPVVGALLMFSLMIGPSAAARSVTARPVLAMTLAVVIALVTVWTGIVVSYVSNWPLGFFVGAMGAAFFLLGRGYARSAAGASGPLPRPEYRGTVNRLKDSASPYLLQHADNPVDWWPWCEAAFTEAARRDLPVMLSVGYAACHWCHVMAHESFEDPATAALLNEHVVAIKVDREERPDVDSVYMTATQAMTGQGGWPMTVFMTPDKEPFFCGTYFPRDRFQQLILGVAQAWRDQRDGVAGQARHVATALAENAAAVTRALRADRGRGAVRRGHGGLGERARARLRRGRRRVRPRAQVPAVDGLGVPAAPSPADRGARRAADGRGHLRGHGPRRHVRPARRGLRPVLDGQRLGGTAFREDALRQRAARPGLPQPVARHRLRAGPAGGAGDVHVDGARDAHRRRRPRGLAGRRQRGRRGTGTTSGGPPN